MCGRLSHVISSARLNASFLSSHLDYVGYYRQTITCHFLHTWCSVLTEMLPVDISDTWLCFIIRYSLHVYICVVMVLLLAELVVYRADIPWCNEVWLLKQPLSASQQAWPPILTTLSTHCPWQLTCFTVQQPYTILATVSLLVWPCVNYPPNTSFCRSSLYGCVWKVLDQSLLNFSFCYLFVQVWWLSHF